MGLFAFSSLGKFSTKASQVESAVKVQTLNPEPLSADTDRVFLVDTSVGAVPFVVNLPAGENGLEFYVKDSGNNAGTNNIQVMPDGLDTMDPAFQSAVLLNNGQCNLYQFFNGVWWVMSKAYG